MAYSRNLPVHATLGWEAKVVTRDELVSLSEPKGLAVSLYLPTQRAGKPTRENPIRMKNRIHEVRSYLDERGWDDRQIDDLLAPALDLLEDYDFWQHQLDGLAVFLAEGEDHRLMVERDLPDLSLVGPRYHLKPLMPLLNDRADFYALAASLGKTRLFEITPDGVNEAELPEDTPRSLAQALRFTDDDPDPTVRWNTMGRSGETGELQALSHGSGPEQPDRKTEILTFFRMLDNGVRSVIEGSEKPLLFMGVEYLFPLYREANHYPHLLDEAVTGNPDQWRPEEIRTIAREAVREHLERPREAARDRYLRLAGTGQTSDSLEEVILAGIDGRIDTLFVALDKERWGTFDSANRKVRAVAGPSLEVEDLLDRAAVEALRTGAALYPVPAEEVPGEGDVAAIYRW